MIKIYSSPFCNNCTIVKNYLKSKDIKPEVINVDDKISEYLTSKGFNSLPVIECNGQLFNNCSQKDLDKVIEEELKGAES